MSRITIKEATHLKPTEVKAQDLPIDSLSLAQHSTAADATGGKTDTFAKRLAPKLLGRKFHDGQERST